MEDASILDPMLSSDAIELVIDVFLMFADGRLEFSVRLVIKCYKLLRICDNQGLEGGVRNYTAKIPDYL